MPRSKPPNDVFWSIAPKSTTENLSLSRVSSLGYQSLQGINFLPDDGIQSNAMLLITLGGKPTVHHGTNTCHPTRGNVSLFLPGEYRRSTASRWEAFWFFFTPSAGLMANLYDYQCVEGRTFDTTLSDSELERIDEIFALPQNAPDPAAHRLGVLIERTILCCLQGAKRQVQRPQHTRLDNIIEYIRLHPGLPHTVESLARMAYLSPSHFSQIFKRHIGATVHQYVTAVRMDQARWLLRNTDLSGAQIAEKLGFANPYHFYNSFKSCHDKTITQYRSAIQKTT